MISSIYLHNKIFSLCINENNALKVVGYFHCRFETIHPFCDGNGRVGRMLINYLLLANNLTPIIVFEDDREEYYLALECFNSKQEINRMVTFLDCSTSKYSF